MLVGQTHRLTMTTGQSFGLAVLAAAIDRAHRVDHMPGREPSARSDDCLSGRQRSNLADDLAAFGEDRGPPAR